MDFWRRKKEKGKARRCFLENGNMFLEQLIADCNGISNPIRMFSSDQISKDTNHFDPKYSLPRNSSWFRLYKCVIEGRSYVIKRFIEPVMGEEEHAYNDIVLSARVSNHSGFLKLVGCCLEFSHPVLLFEDLEYTSLNWIGSVGSEDGPLLPWNVRLKIAKEVATAITYLHTAFPRITIHRDIKATHVFMGKNGTAKLTDFSLAVTLPEGKSWIEDTLSGTVGYIDPIYQSTSIVTEYADVYSFGIFMLVLLIGREPKMDGPDHYHIHSFVKDLKERGEAVELGGDSKDMRPGQMKMFLDLALRCCEERNEDRPKMILVAKQIKLIEQASFEDDQIEISPR
ncbi:serine/threonine-protein kinase ZRK1-like [Raphanus sativus]|uniref:Serine/threonine-protein kinase ZRK1-like n=1 Tax=Raphanus sativus TaxID=3726 RepID=A0A6J0LJG2_RAPSA|nr:serine/threonine-protein kinase ZRK1-like [Raphanus sativus]